MSRIMSQLYKNKLSGILTSIQNTKSLKPYCIAKNAKEAIADSAEGIASSILQLLFYIV
jgi:hypothetical protein